MAIAAGCDSRNAFLEDMHYNTDPMIEAEVGHYYYAEALKYTTPQGIKRIARNLIKCKESKS